MESNNDRNDVTDRLVTGAHRVHDALVFLMEGGEIVAIQAGVITVDVVLDELTALRRGHGLRGLDAQRQRREDQAFHRSRVDHATNGSRYRRLEALIAHDRHDVIEAARETDAHQRGTANVTRLLRSIALHAGAGRLKPRVLHRLQGMKGFQRYRVERCFVLADHRLLQVENTSDLVSFHETFRLNRE